MKDKTRENNSERLVTNYNKDEVKALRGCGEWFIFNGTRIKCGTGYGLCPDCQKKQGDGK